MQSLYEPVASRPQNACSDIVLNPLGVVQGRFPPALTELLVGVFCQRMPGAPTVPSGAV